MLKRNEQFENSEARAQAPQGQRSTVSEVEGAIFSVPDKVQSQSAPSTKHRKNSEASTDVSQDRQTVVSEVEGAMPIVPDKGQETPAPSTRHRKNSEARVGMLKGHHGLASEVEGATTVVPDKGQFDPVPSTKHRKNSEARPLRSKGQRSTVSEVEGANPMAPDNEGHTEPAPSTKHHRKNSEANSHTPKGQRVVASGGGGRATGAHVGPTGPAPSSPIIDHLREQWRRRQAWHRAEKSLTLTAKSMCRRLCEGDKAAGQALYKAALAPMKDSELAIQAYGAMLPIITGRAHIEEARLQLESRITKMVKQLPIAEWWLAIPGCGLLGLVGIIGEAGDLGNYPKHGHLWKRLGLAVMPDGTRQRRVTGDAAIEHGYSPARRSVVWTIGDSLFKSQSALEATDKRKARSVGPYRMIYDVRKEYELARLPADEKGRAGHAHDRAKRYMEKKLIRQLWKQWRKV